MGGVSKGAESVRVTAPTLRYAIPNDGIATQDATFGLADVTRVLHPVGMTENSPEIYFWVKETE